MRYVMRQTKGGKGLITSRQICCLLACFALVGCGDPIADIPRLSEQDLPEGAAAVEIAATPEPQGGSLVERLLGASEGPEEHSLVEPSQERTSDTEPAPKPEPSGFLALFSRAEPAAGRSDPVADAQATEIASTTPEQMAKAEKASLPASPASVSESKRNGIGLFGGAAARSNTRPESEIAPGTVLPYGQVARICGLSIGQMGKKVAQFPENRAKHKIYDSDPGNTAPHSFFITGFDDGCARQFTASLAMFGSVALHEQLRYGLPAEVHPYSDTDKAYDKLKSRVCRVPLKQPCGAKLSRLENNTVFVSIYERFGSNSRWKNLLLHNGQMVATDIKGG